MGRCRSCSARELQRTEAFCNPSPHELCEPNHGDVVLIAKKIKLQYTQQKRDEKDSNRNFKCLQNEVKWDEYYNIVLTYSLN